ncbi:MAG TPA: sigma-54 dependent transcriptional regulator [Pirellulales bacterium]|jgi:DNA-binding NtrC family response regulator
MTRVNRQTISATASAAPQATSGSRSAVESSSGDSQGDCACGRVLVVDDFAQARESIADVLRAAGHQVACAASASEALVQMEKESFDVVVTDLQMPGMTGLEFIKRLHTRPHGAQILMVTAHATVQSAVDAMRHGAFDYIEKPFDVDQLERLVARAMQHGRFLDRSRNVLHSAAMAVMIGSGPIMRALRVRIGQVACTPETVLITGESGTGKELVARAVHGSSNRSHAPLVSLNCPVLSAQLMESELFGHERGAFTGADAPRTGRFELANHGTILLDEVSEIDLPLQAKLLRVLQEKSFERVGSSDTMRVDVRVLATSNRSLLSEISAGRFREDLYYRLAVVPLVVPPLRERREDIPELVAHFLERSAERLERDPCDLEASAMELLCEYSWPGNVRELENIVARASVLNTGRPITADELRGWLSLHNNLMPQHGSAQSSIDNDVDRSAESSGASVSLDMMERKLIEATLERFSGHRAKTAEALGIGLRTLSGKLKQYGYAPRAKNLAKVA